MKRKWYLGAGVTCLLAGPLAQFAQYLVTPVDSGAGGAEQVSQAAAHLPAMWIAVLLDVPLLLIIPAVLYLGAVAGGSRSRLAGTGTALAFLSTLAAVFLVAGDVLLYEAGRRPDLAAATALVKAYQGNAVITGMLASYLAGRVIGFGLLAAALWRARTVPKWAALALAAYPVAEFAGVSAGIVAVGAVSYALAVAGFGACAVALVQARHRPPATSGPAALRQPQATADQPGSLSASSQSLLSSARGKEEGA